jgi:hypothetical protein
VIEKTAESIAREELPPPRENPTTESEQMPTTASKNGKPRLCRIPGCGAQAHGNLLCRVHYDAERYEETTKGSAEDQAAAERERWIEYEFRYGNMSEKDSPHGTRSMFASDEEKLAAWNERKDELLEKSYCGDHLAYVGHRPHIWWCEVGRPDLWPVSPPDYDSLGHANFAEKERLSQEYEN